VNFRPQVKKLARAERLKFNPFPGTEHLRIKRGEPRDESLSSKDAPVPLLQRS
jgi:hypothetical protein